MGLCNDYRRFIPDFAKIAAPLNQQLKNGELANIKLIKAERKTFDDLTSNSTSLLVLELPMRTRQFTIDPDALNGLLECVFFQEQKNKALKLIGWESRSQCSAE